MLKLQIRAKHRALQNSQGKVEGKGITTRAGEDRLIQIARDSRPIAEICPGRPPKRWIKSWIPTSDDST